MVFPLFAAIYYWAPALEPPRPVRDAGPMVVLADVPRLQHRVLSHASAGPVGHAAPCLHLSRRDGLADAEPDCHRRRLHVRGRGRWSSSSISCATCAPRSASTPATSGRPARWNGCPTTSSARAASRRSRAAIRSGSSRDLEHEVEAARHYLPNAPTGARETIITSPIEAAPQYVQRLPGPAGRRFWPRSSRRRSSCC